MVSRYLDKSDAEDPYQQAPAKEAGRGATACGRWRGRSEVEEEKEEGRRRQSEARGSQRRQGQEEEEEKKKNKDDDEDDNGEKKKKKKKKTTTKTKKDKEDKKREIVTTSKPGEYAQGWSMELQTTDLQGSGPYVVCPSSPKPLAKSTSSASSASSTLSHTDLKEMTEYS